MGRFREEIKSIMERDPAARSGWEIVTCYPGFQALAVHRLSHWLWNHKLKWFSRFISHLARIFTGIEIHPAAVIGRRVFIDHGCGVVSGETAEVGDDCTIYQGVTLGGTSLTKGKKRHPTLGNGVICGANAQILGSFTVGDGAKVGSNAVVVREVPPGATAVGNPARIILKEDPKDSAKADAATRLFNSYGITANEDDPLIKALHGLINNNAAQERRIQQLTDALEKAGIAVEAADEEGGTLSTEQLNRLME